jgi:hypothetical protein
MAYPYRQRLLTQRLRRLFAHFLYRNQNQQSSKA